jgi:hypothetical protein
MRRALQPVASFHKGPRGREEREGDEHKKEIQHKFS